MTTSSQQKVVVAGLRSLGVPELLADFFADFVDWHVIADLVARGCPPYLALRIVW